MGGAQPAEREDFDDWFRDVQEALASIDLHPPGKYKQLQTATKTMRRVAGLLRKKILDAQHWDDNLRVIQQTSKRRGDKLDARESKLNVR